MIEEDRMGLPPGYHIDCMTREEAGMLVEWATAEGWNPGLHDLEVAWHYDREAFIALRAQVGAGSPELVGGGVILSYAGRCGFMGLFIMRPDQRRQGIGRVLWHERLRRLQTRLQPGAFIGMDGVFDMVPFYAAGGFSVQHRDLRFQGIADATRLADAADAGACELAAVPQSALVAYDEAVFGVPRGAFLQRWLEVPGGRGRAVYDPAEGKVRGYAFLRPCVSGYKFGPVFADDPGVARTLMHDLLAGVPGEPVVLDVPEPNLAALAIVTELGWNEAFGCARMVLGSPPRDTTHRVFGVTSFEFG